MFRTHTVFFFPSQGGRLRLSGAGAAQEGDGDKADASKRLWRGVTVWIVAESISPYLASSLCVGA
jgi:hypothetical protein